MAQATLCGGLSGIGHKRARDIAAPAHPGAPMAAKPRIQAMIQDAVQAPLLPKQPLETRLAAVLERAISTYLDALDDDDKDTALLYVQKAAPAAEEAWQRTIRGLQEPSVANPTVSTLEHPRARTWTSQHHCLKRPRTLEVRILVCQLRNSKSCLRKQTSVSSGTDPRSLVKLYRSISHSIILEYHPIIEVFVLSPIALIVPHKKTLKHTSPIFENRMEQYFGPSARN